MTQRDISKPFVGNKDAFKINIQITAMSLSVLLCACGIAVGGNPFFTPNPTKQPAISCNVNVNNFVDAHSSQ